MKKLLLFASIAFIGSLNLNAQCTPDPQYTSPGIYPDSATNFAAACSGEAYTQLITNVVPADTTVTVPIFGQITADIDSIVLVDVTGLPPGMDLACNPTSCAYPGGQTGCAIISGTCNTPGTYNLVFNLKAYVAGFPGGPQSFTLDYYKIIVYANCNAGLNETSASPFSMFPNPAGQKVVINGLASEYGVEHITLVNAAGQLVKNISLTEGTSQEINLEGLNHGLYFVKIGYNKGTEVLKLIKE